MTTPQLPANEMAARFERLIEEMRPDLHRYAARMTGSIIDGEDVVQEATIKAHASLSALGSTTNLRGWLFRITHNKAIDHLRRNSHETLELLDEYAMIEDVESSIEEKELAAIAMSVFLKLTPRQRSCVILKDILGYSLAEISELIDATVPEIKAMIHRGRTRLRELARDVDVSPPKLDQSERELLARYVDRFNARDFDAVRTMLADGVQLDLMGRFQKRGKAQVGDYYHNYEQIEGWHLGPGLIEHRPAILVYESDSSSIQPIYFMLISWSDGHVSHIRDFRYARYALRDARIATM